MKIDNVKVPESAFLAQEKDAQIIVNRMASNSRLRKLLGTLAAAHSVVERD